MPHTDKAGDKTAARRAGFTLIELMIVVVILGVLAGLVIPQLMDEPHKARVVKTKMQIESLMTALNKYYVDNGFYPSTEQGLQALVARPTGGQVPVRYPERGYMPKIPKDPWGNDYVYLSPGEHGQFDLSSYGADGKAGGAGNNADIVSWTLE